VSDPVEVPQSPDLEPRLADGQPILPRLAAEPLPLTKRRTGPVLERLGTLAEIVLVSGFPTQLFLIAAMTTFGMQFRTADGQWSTAFVSTLSLLDTALVLGLVFLFLASNGERPREALLGSRSVLREAALGLVLLPIVLLIAVLILGLLFTIAPQLHNVPRNPLEDMLQNRRDAVIFGIVALIAGGVREEVQRGFILLRFRQHLGGGALGVAIYSVMFGLGHVDQGWDAAIAVATLGAIWGTIYLIRGSIVAPMVSHAGFNLAQLIKFMVLR
jgi:membrane protease YdiL (CAAX protease family)